MSIEGSWKVSLDIDGRQVGAEVGLFKDDAKLRKLDVYFDVPMAVRLRAGEADVRVIVEFDPVIAPVAEKAVEDDPPKAEGEPEAEPAAEGEHKSQQLPRTEEPEPADLAAPQVA